MEINPSPKKPDLYVVARFLEKLCTPNKEYKKTELQMAVGLNYNVYTKYLKWLEEKGLIVIKNEGPRHVTVKITKKGLDAYNTLAMWIKDVIGDL